MCLSPLRMHAGAAIPVKEARNYAESEVNESVDGRAHLRAPRYFVHRVALD